MSGRRPPVAPLLLAGLFWWMPAAGAQGADAGSPVSNWLGSIDSPPYLRSAGEDASFQATIRFGRDLESSSVEHVQFALDAQGARLGLRLLNAATPSGTPLRLSADERGSGERPAVIVRVSDIVAAGSVVVLQGEASPRMNGQHAFGVLVLGFDADWKVARHPGGEPAELYGQTMFVVSGLAKGFALSGKGNVGATFLVPLGVALVAVALLIPWHRVRATGMKGSQLVHANLRLRARR